MYVWVVIMEIPYEPGSILGIWSTKELAEVQSKRLAREDDYLHYYVEKVTVDTECRIDV